MGFCVAITRNGSRSRCVSRPIVTCRSCIASRRRALHLRRGTVDLVRKDEFAGVRDRRDLELAVLLIEDSRSDDVGRDEVGGELDALELAADGLGERLHRHRLREPGRILDEEVPPCGEGDHHPLQQSILTDDYALTSYSTCSRDASSVGCGLMAPLVTLVGRLRRLAAPIGTAKPMPAK